MEKNIENKFNENFFLNDKDFFSSFFNHKVDPQRKRIVSPLAQYAKVWMESVSRIKSIQGVIFTNENEIIVFVESRIRIGENFHQVS